MQEVEEVSKVLSQRRLISSAGFLVVVHRLPLVTTSDNWDDRRHLLPPRRYRHDRVRRCSEQDWYEYVHR